MVLFLLDGMYKKLFQSLRHIILALLRTSYRPISLSSNISKVLEHLVFNKLSHDHVSTSISALHFGFTEKSPTLQQLLLFIDSIINHPSQTDVSKAFDTVSHDILLSKLCHFGISDSLWAWFKNYLSIIVTREF